MKDFRKAIPEEANQIADLTNGAYRGDSSKLGWTTEADLLDGLRITSEEVKEVIQLKDNWFFILSDGAKLVASVHVRKESPMIYFFGMLAVDPQCQNRGIGKVLMKGVEEFIKAQGGELLRLHVIEVRSELIACYERWGYKKTGKYLEFPMPQYIRGAEFQLLEMEKGL